MSVCLFLASDKTSLVQDIKKARSDGICPCLGVHVQLVKGTWPYMLRVRVGAIIGEPFSSFFSLTHQASVLSHQDVFSVFRLVPGLVYCILN